MSLLNTSLPSFSRHTAFAYLGPLLSGLALGLGVSFSLQAQELPTVLVRVHPVDLTLPVEAVVEAINQATVAAQVSGRITEMRVDVGQIVKKGELLMRIDAREAVEAAAGAAAQSANSKANYERQKRLRQQNFISQAALDKAKADDEAAQATTGQARVGLGYATVTAPISGIVAQRSIEVGEMAVPGKPLLTLYEPSGLRVTASIPQHKLPQMRRVTQARIEFPEGGQWLEATKVTLLPTVDASTHIAQVRVTLPADLTAEGREARFKPLPGMFARVHFVIGQANKLTVPQAAVVRRGEVAAVYVRGGAGRLSLRQLRLGEAVGQGETEVLAGLLSGDRVVLDPVKAAIQLKSAPKPGPGAPSVGGK